MSLNSYIYIFFLMSCIVYSYIVEAYIEDIKNNDIYYDNKLDNSSDIRSKDDYRKSIIKNRLLIDNNQDNNKEMEALLLGRDDYIHKDIIQMKMNMKPLLCVTFIKSV